MDKLTRFYVCRETCLADDSANHGNGLPIFIVENVSVCRGFWARISLSCRMNSIYADKHILLNLSVADGL
jgi:hypothetical protein